MQTIHLSLSVRAPDDADPDEVRQVISTMLDVGYADAVETSENDELESPDADLAACLEIDEPALSPPPTTSRSTTSYGFVACERTGRVEYVGRVVREDADKVLLNLYDTLMLFGSGILREIGRIRTFDKSRVRVFDSLELLEREWVKIATHGRARAANRRNR